MTFRRLPLFVRARIVAALLAAVVIPALGAAPPAHAAPLNLRHTLSGPPVSHTPGPAAAAPSAQAVAEALQQDTGLSPAQVTAVDVCPAPAPGQAQCDAQTLRLRSGRALVHPRAHRHATLTQIVAGRRAGVSAAAAAAPATVPAAAAPPQPGTPAWLQQAYDLGYLSQTAGGSDTVAIVDAGDDPTAETDLGAYRSTYGLPACTSANGCFAKVNQSGAPSPLPATA